jgi:hypothetical protein
MTERLDTEVQKLRDNFQEETGHPFKHFFCPILHVDEDVPLCEGQSSIRHFAPATNGCPNVETLTTSSAEW